MDAAAEEAVYGQNAPDTAMNDATCTNENDLVSLSEARSDTSSEDDVPPPGLLVDHYVPGYPRLAASEDCDPAFLIYRKFGWLHNRVLLHRQDELLELEEELERLDARHYKSDKQSLQSRRRDDAIGDERKNLLRDIEDKLATYDRRLLRYQKIQAMRQPTEQNQQSVHNLISNASSLVQSEADWIRRSDDLVALAPDEEAGWADKPLLDIIMGVSRPPTSYIFRTRAQGIKTVDEIMFLLSAERLRVLHYIVTSILATAFVLLPINILGGKTGQGVGGTLSVLAFSLFFAASCSLFTNARRKEVFIATMIYCTALVYSLRSV
ncbi:hypothetical protein MMC13_005012 [Lambiella insularis]|nr:hypothetical protein [Lambiella insularis]